MNWGAEEIEYLEDNWGAKPIPLIAKNLNKSVSSIINKKERMKLGSFLENGDYITIHQLFKAIGREGGISYTLEQWVNKGFPMKKKRVVNSSFKIIYLNDFWKWAEEYRMHIDFAKFKENTLGEEPAWVKEQRAADIAFSKYKTTPWTPKEDALFKSLLKSYQYTYKELSLRLLRTEGAIKRRYHDLKIKEWPIRQDVIFQNKSAKKFQDKAVKNPE